MSGASVFVRRFRMVWVRHVQVVQRCRTVEEKGTVMAKSESFDITTGCDLQEVDNAVNQAVKEITGRYDFKGVLVEVE